MGNKMNIETPKQFIDLTEVYEAGFMRGNNCASWCDMPDIGEKIPRHIDWVGYGVVTEENQHEVHELYAMEGESNSRDFSPFEFTAHELNEMSDPDAAWEAFDAGIHAGVVENLKKLYAD